MIRLRERRRTGARFLDSGIESQVATSIFSCNLDASDGHFFAIRKGAGCEQSLRQMQLREDRMRHKLDTMKKDANTNQSETGGRNQAVREGERDLVEKVKAFHARVENEVFNGQRNAKTLFAIPSSMVKSAKVTFPNSRKAFF